MRAYFPRMQKSEVDAVTIELEDRRRTNSTMPRIVEHKLTGTADKNNSVLATFPGLEENEGEERETFLHSLRGPGSVATDGGS